MKIIKVSTHLQQLRLLNLFGVYPEGYVQIPPIFFVEDQTIDSNNGALLPAEFNQRSDRLEEDNVEKAHSVSPSTNYIRFDWLGYAGQHEGKSASFARNGSFHFVGQTRDPPSEQIFLRPVEPAGGAMHCSRQSKDETHRLQLAKIPSDN